MENENGLKHGDEDEVEHKKVEESKYNILILGGCGFIGRNLLLFLLNEKLVKYVKIVDKITPMMAYMHPIHMAGYQSTIVEFHQADLTKSEHLERVFKTSIKFNCTIQFDFVFNLAAETRFGQPEQVYASRCADLSYLCAMKSAECGVKRFIEVSTAYVYDHSINSCTENAPINPGTTQARYKYEGELRLMELMQSSSNSQETHPPSTSSPLEIIILRPANVYGTGDTHQLMTRIICATLYQFSLHETMSLPFSGEMAVNTVHIVDVCTAIWYCAIHREIIPSGSIFNLCDKNETTQESFTQILSDILGVTYNYYGFFINGLIRHRPHEVIGFVNHKHLKAWDQLCQLYHVDNTPLSPYITVENILDHSLSIDGSLIESFGFHYRYPRMIPDEIKHSILFSIETGIFPPVIS